MLSWLTTKSGASIRKVHDSPGTETLSNFAGSPCGCEEPLAQATRTKMINCKAFATFIPASVSLAVLLVPWICHCALRRFETQPRCRIPCLEAKIKSQFSVVRHPGGNPPKAERSFPEAS